MLTQAQFMEFYGSPFFVDEVYLEDVPCLRLFYRDKMLECNSVAKMRYTAAKFKFLAGSVVRILADVPEIMLADLKHILSTQDPIPFVWYDVCVPPIMLEAHLISREYKLPEYYAAVQYISGYLHQRETEARLKSERENNETDR
jgi:hypothetical protein